MTRDAATERPARQLTATVLFADVVGFAPLSQRVGTERAYLAVTELLRQLDAVARKHGGSVDKYQGDKLMAVFGHPVPLDQAARSAAAAALEMRQAVADFEPDPPLPFGFGIRMGINTGPLVAGDIRGPVVREFHVLGDAVNVAARLNARAPVGEIWVGERSHREAGPEYVWRTLEPLALKGKSRKVAAYALEHRRGSPIRERLGFDDRVVTACVGRDEILARLGRGVGDLRAGSARSLLLRGEADSGKSRILAALGERFVPPDVEVFQMRGLENERDRLGAALESMTTRLDPLGGDEADPSAERGKLADLLDERLGDPAAGPTLLVVEDAQWLDASSRARVERWLAERAASPLLVLLTARPGPESDRLAELIQANGASGEVIEVRPLSADSVEALLRSVLGDDVEDETLALIAERGGALPGPLLNAAFLASALQSEREHATERADRTAEAERRRAVVVLADLTGFTAMTEKLGAEEAFPIVAHCLAMLDETARAHGGTIDHYLGDCVMALFGVPQALEDAPRSALNAAIEMRSRVRAYSEAQDLAVPVDVHVGVATGLGIAGDISGPLIREFAVMGDHVDRADRLTHAAEAGEIRVDEATFRATRDLFDLVPSEVRDATQPDRAWDLLSTSPHLYRAERRPDSLVASALVGRDPELAILRALRDRLYAGQGGMINVIAEAGIGKSRLIASFRDEDDGALWLRGRSISNGGSLSYHPIADMLRAWSGIQDEDAVAIAREKLRALVRGLLADAPDEVVALISPLLGVELGSEDEERLAGIQGDAREKLFRSGLVRLLRAACMQRPVVVLMEDLHWADASSIELLESLVRVAEDGPILFLNVFRPGFEQTSERARVLVRDREADAYRDLVLEPLSDGAARQLVKNLFRGGDVPQQTRAAIEERARGNPFYIEEVVRTLVDAEALVLRDGRLQATEKLADVAIPGTVQEAVLARVDRLPLPLRNVLQAASVVGQIFHPAVLSPILGAPDDLEARLETLERAEFITPTDRFAGVEFGFKHPLIQEVTYDSIIEARAAELHRAAARAAEEALPDSMPGYSAMVAYHYTKGGELDEADAYLIRAGEEAARSAASNEALHFFRAAANLVAERGGADRDPRRNALLEKNLAIALLNRGLLMEAVGHFDRCTDLMGMPSPREGPKMALSFARDLVRVMGRVYLSRHPFGRRPSTEDERELVDVMFRRAMAQSTVAPTRFLVDSIKLINQFSRIDPLTVPETAAIYSGVIAIFSFGGLSFGVSRRFLDLASRLAEAGAIEDRRLYYRTLRFLHHLLEGDWSDSHAIEMADIDRGLRDGWFWEASTYVNLDGVRLLYQGRFDLAKQRIEKLREIADLYEHDLAASAQHALTAYLHVERRDFEPALHALETYYDEHAEATFNLLALGTRAKVRCLDGDLPGAEQDLERAERVLEAAGRPVPYHAGSVHSARYLLDVSLLERHVRDGTRPPRALTRRLKRSRARAFSSADKVAFRRPEVLRLAGREAWLGGRRREAFRHWQSAHRCSDRLGAEPERARILLEVARALDPASGTTFEGRTSADCLEEARETFASLDLAFDLSLAQRAG